MAKSIWPKASSIRVARALEAHSVLALALGGLIYILALTGSILVFNHDLQRWEQPAVPEMETISPEAAAKAAKTVFESEDSPTTHLYINFPQPDLPRTVITTDTQAFFANADGSIHSVEHFPWTQFLLDLHYYLHLPQILGLTIVGALGAMLIALSMSGLLAHPRIFKDAFTFRRGADRVAKVDLHNRLSVWTLPFHFSNALTGAILGLASIFAFAIAIAGFGGDTGKVFDPIFGSEPIPNEASAPLASIQKPLEYMQTEYPDLLPAYFILHDPGTAGQHSSVIAEHADRLIFGEYYNFNAEGAYQGNLGISDGTLGQQIIGSVYNVHFGNWGGLPVKLAYLIFGLALCFIIASGLGIYFRKRRDKGHPAPRLESAWEGLIWGTPFMLALTLFVSSVMQAEAFMLAPLFWLGSIVICIIGAIIANQHIMVRVGRIGSGAATLIAVFGHAFLNIDGITSSIWWSGTISLSIVGITLVTSGLRSGQRLSDNFPDP